ncbi:MAG: DUF2802 domain-containing protein [Chromatiales bacterium]|jgi:hypothetical protein|nr:DUF2802 domain-containing protein [Chromatiales bacterium]
MSDLTSWILLAGVLVITDGLILWCAYLYFGRREKPASVADRAKMQADFVSLRAAMEGLDDCLATVDGAVRRAAPAMRALNTKDGGRRTYHIANKLARKGADVAELMADCDLSRGEAQLIHNLNVGAHEQHA